jgi:hypothetical protein
MLWVPKLILDAVVAFISHGTGNLNRIWKLVVIELGTRDLECRLGSLTNTMAAGIPSYGRARAGRRLL